MWKTDNEIVITVIAGTVLIFLLCVVITLSVIRHYLRQQKFVREKQTMQNTFNQEILKTQLETQEATFHQISEELHDNVGQLLSTTKMLVGIAERALKEPPDALKTASETLSKAIQDLRSLSKSLSNEWLHQFNIIENLQAEIDRLKAAREVEALLQSNIHMLPLEPQEQVMLFRVMQEALQNSIKHAHATVIKVAIEVGNDNVYLCLSDNGFGFDVAAVAQSGVGIMNMKHRVALLRGRIDWTSAEGKGTKVEINLPIKKTGE